MKAKIVERVLEFLARYASLSKAKVATLGGKGVEAEVWLRHKIPTDNGWVIERSKSKSQQIIACGYRFLNQLKGFPVILDGFPENSNFIDCFHYDISGTFSGAKLEELVGVMPYLLKSRGRCLVITLADGRRNMILENWNEYILRAYRLLGLEWRKYFDFLIAEQKKLVPTKEREFILPFDAVKAAKREFGFLLDLLEVLERVDKNVSFERVERYAYVSRYAGNPFRMRTYIIHLNRGFQSTLRNTFDVWVRSKLYLGTPKGELLEVAPTVTTGEAMTLDQFVSCLSDSFRQEYLNLKMKADRFDQLSTMFVGAVSPVPKPAPTENVQAQSRRRIKKVWNDLSACEQATWLIETLEKKNEAGSAWNNLNQWAKWVKLSFGHYNTELGKSLRSAMARTSGKFRPQFIERIYKNCGTSAEALIERLNKVTPE